MFFFFLLGVTIRDESSFFFGADDGGLFWSGLFCMGKRLGQTDSEMEERNGGEEWGMSDEGRV